MFLTVTPLLYPKTNVANGQNTMNKTQLWLDKLNNIKIEFMHSPENPVTDMPTELKYNTLNLKTGEQLKNISASVIILTSSNGEESFYRYTNVTASTGNFSVRYIFPFDGLYKVISKIESKDTSTLTLASFPVFVSLQSGSALNKNAESQLFLTALLVGIAAAIGIVLFLIIINRRRKEKKQNL